MRILSISGEGIRSLAAPFKVEISAGLLAQGGLFAIVGPTGAGKSTLLDTLCLALYGRVPRVTAKVGGVRIQDGEGSLSESDPRTCLSHGVGEGRAEVEFAVGTCRYRATWRVHRARLKPGGNLQNDRMEITDLGQGKTLADKKKEVEALVTSLTGLDFEQFQRSAMLAQGQFARFLEAGEKERAELLETITGETIYSQLSVAAYGKAQRMNSLRESLTMRAGALALPTEEQFSLATAQLTEAEQARAAAAAIQEGLAREVRWYETLAELQQKAEQARVDAALADDAWTAFGPSLAELERGAKARELRAESEALAKARLRLLAADQLVANGERAQGEARATLVRVQQREAVAVAELAGAKLTQQEGQAKVHRARELDGQVLQCLTRLEEGQRESSAAMEAAISGKGELERLVEQRKEAVGKEQRAAAWLAANASLQAIAERAPAVIDSLQAMAHLASSQATARAAQARGESEAGELAVRVKQTKERLRQGLETLCREIGLDAGVGPSQEELHRAIDGARFEARNAVEAARQRFQQAELLSPARGLRQGLVPGQACPVCGATHHPAATVALEAPELHPLSTALEEARQRAEKTEGFSEQRLALESLSVTLERQQNLLAESQRSVLAATTELAALAGQMDGHRGRLEPLLGPWRSTWEQENPGALCQELERLLPELAIRAADLVAATQAAVALAPALAVAEAACENRDLELARLLARDEEAQGQLAILRQRRGALLDGRKVDQVVTEWEAQIATREAALAAARLATQQAEAAAVEAQTRSEEAGKAAAIARGELEQVTAKWRAALAKAQLPEPEIAELLARGEEWYRGLQVARDRTHEAQVRCARALEIRREELAHHEAQSTRPTRDKEAVEKALSDARLALESADGDLLRLFAVRQEMAKARVLASQLVDDLEQHDRVAAPWVELNDLMGSADGARFRKFAQGLALVQLLSLANVQMARLKPRYVIQRVPGTDLEIAIIDRHQADQIRPVSSLSGGETFLVSLALALGLAQLTGGGSPIQSLFIDEGFGALDQETLDDALETLDLLQSEGKTIGIISHVEALRERIASQIIVVPKGAGRSELEVRL